MEIKYAHYKTKSTTGQFINIAVFEAKPRGSINEATLRASLDDLVTKAIRAKRIKIDQAALTFVRNGKQEYWSIAPQLAINLAQANSINWTGKVNV